jgi:inhibitor of nuclear factor kappa-B kinase subunit alpha
MEEARRQVIVGLYESGMNGYAIYKMLKSSGYAKSTVYDVIARYTTSNTTARKHGSGTICSQRTPALVKRVRERIRRNPQRSLRKMAPQLNISARTLGRVVKENLHMKTYSCRRADDLTPLQIEKRVTRCKAFIQRHGDLDVRRILFSDEKIFTVEAKKNAHNNKFYAINSISLPASKRIVKKRQFPEKLMVWLGASYHGLTPVHFVEEKAKVNQHYYLHSVLEPLVLPRSQTMFAGENWVFQQDGATSHTARLIQNWCSVHLPSFITKDQWPPASLDLNPLDYYVWGRLEANVNRTQHRSLASLRSSIEAVCAALPFEELRASIDSWWKRLRACIRSKGHRFEFELGK